MNLKYLALKYSIGVYYIYTINIKLKNIFINCTSRSPTGFSPALVMDGYFL